MWICSSLLIILLFAAACQPIQPQAAQPSAQNVDAKIQNAMSAAPPAVAKDATIIDWPATAGGELIVLRQGTNGWTCYTDRPVSPGNDPQCYDKQWEIVNDAMMSGKPYTTTAPGIGYMLQGGSDESNTDPMATGPAPGDDWISTPPHIMILSPGGFDAADFANEPKQDEPYIMWDGTPYEHLMVPVVPTAKEAMGDADAVMQNTLSSTPAGITLHATIKGYPAKEGDPLVVLREGTNGWVCNPDRTVSPGNDPSCNNATMENAFNSFPNTVVTKPGISYMLQGGSDESNMDPMASGPAPGEDWVTTPPHIMLMVPGGFDSADFTTDHTSGYPYIMYEGSVVEHLMIPVNTTEMNMQH